MKLQDTNGLQLADAMLEECNKKDDLELYRKLCLLLAKVSLSFGDYPASGDFTTMEVTMPIRRKQ